MKSLTKTLSLTKFEEELEKTEVDAREAVNIKASIIYNIWKHSLFSQAKCKNMSQYCDKRGIARSTAYWCIERGKMMAFFFEKTQDNFNGVLTSSQAEFFAQKQREYEKLQARGAKLLISDGTDALVPAGSDYSLDEVSDEVVISQEDAVLFEYLAEEKEKKDKAKLAAHRTRKTKKQKYEETRESVVDGILTGLQSGAKNALSVAMNYKGFKESEREIVEYYARQLLFYVQMPGRSKDSGAVWNDVTFEDAQKAMLHEDLIPSTGEHLDQRPDVLYGLGHVELPEA